MHPKQIQYFYNYIVQWKSIFFAKEFPDYFLFCINCYFIALSFLFHYAYFKAIYVSVTEGVFKLHLAGSRYPSSVTMVSGPLSWSHCASYCLTYLWCYGFNLIELEQGMVACELLHVVHFEIMENNSLSTVYLRM